MNTKDLDSNPYGVGFDSDSFVKSLFDEGSCKEIDIDEPDEIEPKGHVMSKEEFMTCVRRDCARKEDRKRLEARKEMDKKKTREADSQSYIIEKMIYNRKKRDRLKAR